MNTTYEAVMVTRDENNEIVAIVAHQLHLKSHIFYKTERMSADEIADILNQKKIPKQDEKQSRRKTPTIEITDQG